MSHRSRIFCLSNVYDQNYADLRREQTLPSLSSPKRRDLFRCLELASSGEVVVLSSPPKTLDRKGARWLPAVETRFSTHRQLFCANLDVPKIRIPLSWLFYARHVLRNVADGDIVLIDNYELLYVLAARVVRRFRNVTFLLEYEDGKHLIDKGVYRLLSGLAERLGRPLLKGALLTHPGLKARLPEGTPTELVPGFVRQPPAAASSGEECPVRFLYTGSLDTARGVDLLLSTLETLPADGWRLDVTGIGPLAPQVRQTAQDPRWKGKFTFHGHLSSDAFKSLIAHAHVGLSCQRSSDPISSVTFPSKVFSYLSAGLLVLSSRASEVPAICGDACFYFDEETPEALAKSMGEIIRNPAGVRRSLHTAKVFERYSIEGTAARLKKYLDTIAPSQSGSPSEALLHDSS